MYNEPASPLSNTFVSKIPVLIILKRNWLDSGQVIITSDAEYLEYRLVNQAVPLP